MRISRILPYNCLMIQFNAHFSIVFVTFPLCGPCNFKICVILFSQISPTNSDDSLAINTFFRGRIQQVLCSLLCQLALYTHADSLPHVKRFEKLKLQFENYCLLRESWASAASQFVFVRCEHGEILKYCSEKFFNQFAIFSYF